jgi:hypothetical protein
LGSQRQGGKRFADRLASAYVNIVALDFQSGWSRKEQYLLVHLQQADARVDSEATRWPEIVAILRAAKAYPKGYPG